MFIAPEKREVFPNRESSQEALDETGKLFLKAAALIEDRGLARGVAQDSRGRLCIVGALNLAHGGEAHDSSCPLRTFERFQDATGQMLRTWNDQRGRTKEEVVAKLRAVALGG
jgi:hypothetical protein